SLILRFRFALAHQEIAPGIMALSNEVMFKTHLHLDGLALGVFFAASRKTWGKWGESRAKRSLAAGIVIFLGTLYAAGPYLEGWAIVYCFMGLAIGVSLLLPYLLIADLPSAFSAITQRIALWSYGIYIWNDVVSRALHKVETLPWAESYAIFLLAAFGVAILTYYGIERPFLLMRERILVWLRA
ncbi:MAG: hypothetical protein ACXVBE_14825, partial [Bdellovibrionota bacterium]